MIGDQASGGRRGIAGHQRLDGHEIGRTKRYIDGGDRRVGIGCPVIDRYGHVAGGGRWLGVCIGEGDGADRTLIGGGAGRARERDRDLTRCRGVDRTGDTGRQRSDGEHVAGLRIGQDDAGGLDGRGIVIGDDPVGIGDSYRGAAIGIAGHKRGTGRTAGIIAIEIEVYRGAEKAEKRRRVIAIIQEIGDAVGHRIGCPGHDGTHRR